ncbi:MAG: hypothetical protein HZB39_07455 [Planctomycetes bacterium]|nr:hypothetical protein [Planctomycetota bacterium]
MLLLLGIAVTGFSMHTARRLATARAQAEARFAARRSAATATRPDVFGAALPGAAWSDWIPAIAAIDMTELDALESALADEPGARATSPLELGRLDEAIAHHVSALDALVRGARRATGRFPIDDPRQTAVLDDAFRPLALGRLAARAAERRMAQSDADGIDLALAAAQFGRDLADQGPTLAAAIGMQAVVAGARTLARLAATQPLDGAIRARIGSAARVLDESWPSSCLVLAAEHDWTATRLGLVAATSAAPVTPSDLGIPILALWRHGFSTNAAVASWWELALEREGRAKAAAALPWPQARAEYAAIDALAATKTHALLTTRSDHADHAMREGLAAIRVLREVIAAAAGEPPLGLLDPFTLAPLERAARDGAIVISSADANLAVEVRR